MSIALLLRIEALEKKIAEHAKALETAAVEKVHNVELATKDDLDAFLGRLRAFEGGVSEDLKAIKAKLKL